MILVRIVPSNIELKQERTSLRFVIINPFILKNSLAIKTVWKVAFTMKTRLSNWSVSHNFYWIVKLENGNMNICPNCIVALYAPLAYNLISHCWGWSRMPWQNIGRKKQKYTQKSVFLHIFFLIGSKYDGP